MVIISKENLHDNDDWAANNLPRLRSLADKGCRILVGADLENYLYSGSKGNNRDSYYDRIKPHTNKIIRIINTRIPSGGWNSFLIKGRLKRLRSFGVPVENYSNKRRDELINYYIQLRNDLKNILM